MMTKEEFDRLEDIADRLMTMRTILGLSRTEKETLEEAAKFIDGICCSTGYPIEDEDEDEDYEG